MVALVTQEEVVRQLRLNSAALAAEEIADVMFKADQASAVVVDYLKRPFEDGQATVNPLIYPPGVPVPVPWTESTVPTLVKTAILIVLTTLYDGRTPEDVLLSEPVRDILHRLRDPTLA